MNGNRPEHLRGYDEARRFWEERHSNPDGDQRVTDPWAAIIGLLIEPPYGQHPIEAAWTARVALDNVIEAMNLTRQIEGAN